MKDSFRVFSIERFHCMWGSGVLYFPLYQALKTKQKVTDQKLQQGEESYSQAKQLFDEITDELYEELPTFFDR